MIKGTDVQADRRAARFAGTFEELADKYRDEYAKKRNKSWKQADGLVRRYLHSWNKLGVRDIARADVRAAFRRVTTAHGPVLANQVLASASAIFAWAINQEVGGLTVNPCVGVERHTTKDRERVLADEEVPAFWAAFDDVGLVRGSALRVLLLTGQRPGEVRAMRREHLSVGTHHFKRANGRPYEARGAWWNMPGAPDAAIGWPGTKNGQSHRVWLPQAVVDIVLEVCDGETGFVFSARGGARTHNLDGAMRDICATLGIVAPDKVTPHDLRRTHGTTITGSGYLREQMDRIQNHKDGGVGSVYDRHGYADEFRRIQESVVSRLLSLATSAQTDKVVQFAR